MVCVIGLTFVFNFFNTEKLCVKLTLKESFPANIYLFKMNNRCTRKRSKRCSKSMIKTLKGRQLRGSGVFIANFEYISHLFPSVSIVGF